MISVIMAPGEADREKEMRRAMDGDKRFGPLVISSEIPVDLQFSIEVPCTEDFCIDGKIDYVNCLECGGTGHVPKILNMELKMPQDFVQSVLNGHLTDQVFSMLEARKDGCTVILGDSMAIYEAIQDASKVSKSGKWTTFLKGAELSYAVATNHFRCKSFRKRSFLNGMPVFHKGDDSGFFDSDNQFKDILELAHDYLCDGSLFGFVNRPADNMRELAAAAMLFPGVGAKTLEPVIKEYKLALIPRGSFARQPCDLPGIGPKRAAVIDQRIKMVYGV